MGKYGWDRCGWVNENNGHKSSSGHGSIHSSGQNVILSASIMVTVHVSKPLADATSHLLLDLPW